MNIYATFVIGSALFIPAALLYRILNPLETEASRRSKAWAIEREKLPDAPHGVSLSPCRNDAQWINSQWVPNAVIAAEAARVSAARQAKQAAWDASLLGRSVNKAKNVGVAVGVTLVLAPFVILLLAVPTFLIFGIFGLIAFKIIALGLLIAWCLNDFKNDVADEVVRRQKSAK